MPKYPSDPSDPSGLNSISEAENLLKFCNGKGIRLFLDTGRLLFDAPTGALDDRLRADLVARKADLIALLTANPPAMVADAPPEALDAGLRAEAGPAAPADAGLCPKKQSPRPPTEPDPYDALRGPRRTPWGTLAWSDPAAPPIELFGPPPPTNPGGPR